MAGVVVRMTSDEAQLYRGMQKLVTQQEKLGQKLKKTGQAARDAGRVSESAARKQKTAMERVSSSVRGVISQYTTATAALQLLNRAMEHSNQLAQESKDANLTVGQSQAGVIKNLGLGVSDKEAKGFLESIEGIRQKSGFQSVTQLNQAAASVLSGTGGDQKQTLEILEKAAVFFKDAPDDLAEFGGALADAMKVTGSSDAKETLGLLLAIQGQARFTSLSGFKQVAPALAAGSIVNPESDKIERTRETAALFAAIGGRVGDPDAAITRSAVIALEANLASVVPEANSTFERLEKVWADTSGQLAEQVIAGGGFRAQTKSAAQELLAGKDTQTSQMIGKSFDAIRGSVESTDAMMRQLTGLTQELRTVSAITKTRGDIERLKRGATRTERGTVSDIVNETTSQINFAGTTAIEDYAQVAWRKFYFSTFTDQRAESGIKELKSLLRGPDSLRSDETLEELNQQNSVVLGAIRTLEEQFLNRSQETQQNTDALNRLNATLSTSADSNSSGGAAQREANANSVSTE